MQHGREARVLVVDDDPLSLRSVARTLRSRCAVTTANGVAEALYQIGRHAPDVLVTDLHMPPPTTEDMLALVAERHPNVRRLLVTATVRDETFQPIVENRLAERVIRKGTDDATTLRDAVTALATDQGAAGAQDAIARTLLTEAADAIVQAIGQVHKLRATSGGSEDERRETARLLRNAAYAIMRLSSQVEHGEANLGSGQ